MSEHIQPAPTPQGAHAAAVETHEHTPGVAHESLHFDFRLVVSVGIGLAVTALVVHLIVWWLFVGFEKHNTLPNEGASELALEDANRPFGERVANVPLPHLEGIERQSSLLILRTGENKEERFYVSPDVEVWLRKIEDTPKKMRLFDLREGQRVTVTYYMPNGVGGAVGVVTAVTTPPKGKVGKNTNTKELPDVTHTLNGTVVRLVPRSIQASREWAEVQKDRFGWADRAKDIVHIPIGWAIEDVLKSKEFGGGKDKKSTGRTTSPGRANSGREPAGGK